MVFNKDILEKLGFIIRDDHYISLQKCYCSIENKSRLIISDNFDNSLETFAFRGIVLPVKNMTFENNSFHFDFFVEDLENLQDLENLDEKLRDTFETVFRCIKNFDKQEIDNSLKEFSSEDKFINKICVFVITCFIIFYFCLWIICFNNLRSF